MPNHEQWNPTAHSNTNQLTQAVSDLSNSLHRSDYRDFWGRVKTVSALFKELKPTLRDQRDSLWQQFGDLCTRAMEEQGRQREHRERVSQQKRQLHEHDALNTEWREIMGKIDSLLRPAQDMADDKPRTTQLEMLHVRLGKILERQWEIERKLLSA